MEEFDSEETIDAIRDVLEGDGHEVIKLGGDTGLIDRLRQTSIDIVFNIAEGLRGRNREAHIPALLEFLNIPYTGSDPLTLSLTLDKSMAKRVVMSEGIPTPRFKKVERMEDLEGLGPSLSSFREVVLRGIEQRGSVGFKSFGSPISGGEDEMAFRKLWSSPSGGGVCQGPEFTVGILGNENPYCPRCDAD